MTWKTVQRDWFLSPLPAKPTKRKKRDHSMGAQIKAFLAQKTISVDGPGPWEFKEQKIKPKKDSDILQMNQCSLILW
jgi:hypothetical protein